MGCGAEGGCPSADLPDYYRLLQVDPDAPQELIAEAYWHLAGRLQKSRQERPGLRELLDALNEAYATLTSPEQRTAYEATLPRVRSLRQERARPVRRARRRPWLSLLARTRRSRLLPVRSDYYAALCVDPSAEPAIVDKAHSMLRLLHSNGLAQARGLATSAVELEEAYAVLADPARRAEYDASRALPAGTDVSHPAVPPVPATPIALPSPSLEATAATSETAAATDEASPEVQMLEGVGEKTAPAEAAWSARLRELAHRASAAAGALLTSAVRVGGQQLREAPDDLLAERLRREVQPLPPGELGRERADEQPPLARLILMDRSGAKQIVELGPEPVTLGAGPTCEVLLEDETGVVAAQHARIWYGGGRFILNSLAGPSETLAGGKPLTWAALEHGDEIQIGSWRIRFEMLQPQTEVPEHLRARRPD